MEPLKNLGKDVWKDVSEKLKFLAGSWPSYAALGSFVLYVAGYLSLRFHLTVLGVGTDLTVLDERYLFAGAKFLVYAVSSIPIVVLVGLAIFLVGYLPIHALRWVLPQAAKKAIGEWWTKGNRITWAGIILSVVLIQTVMRQCFTLSNLLVTKQPSGSHWLLALLTKQVGWEPFYFLYFPGLVAGIVLVGGLWWNASRLGEPTTQSVWLGRLLALLLAIQILLLPVNYGTLIMDQAVPRVTTPKAWPDVHREPQVWLVWEGEDAMTYLARDKEAPNRRTLMTLKKDDVSHTEILCYDQIMSVVFKHEQSCEP